MRAFDQSGLNQKEIDAFIEIGKKEEAAAQAEEEEEEVDDDADDDSFTDAVHTLV
jgi:hypothetical protein